MKIKPIRVGLLALDGCYASSLGGFADVLQVANAHLRQQASNANLPLRTFSWQFVASGGKPVTLCNRLRITPDAALPGESFDLVFVPGLFYAGRAAFTRQLDGAQAQRDWVRAQWEGGAVVAANCTGTFLLAETGLLDGHTATTTWWLERMFRARYRAVRLDPRALVTDADRLSCAGASASYLVQAVRMVERFAGPTVAALTARTMLIDVSQTGQSALLPLQAEAEHGDALIARAQHWLRQHLAEPVRLAAVAEVLAISERSLIRRFNRVLGATPIAYLKTLRIEAAKVLLDTSNLGVEEISRQVGYQDTSSFTRLFREMAGLTPSAYRNRALP